jgi:hypothetical protein
MSFVNVDDTITNTHNGVHVVGVDDGCHIVFRGNVVNQFVDYQGGFGVKPGVRLVAEALFGI